MNVYKEVVNDGNQRFLLKRIARPPCAMVPLPRLLDIVHVGFFSSACMEAKACFAINKWC